MYDMVEVIRLLNQLEQQALALQASIEAMRQTLEPESVWSEEEEANYRMRHSS